MQRVVVFKDPIEFEKLKRLFYGSYEEQVRALALAKAYQVRGHLPASIHLTALIISALHNDTPQNDMYAIRQTYAMAIIRLVNEILDSAQIGRVAAPLHALARDLKLPSSFVELRHAATHEELPTIYLLRKLAHQAMDWLWDAYWSKNRPKRLSAEPDSTDSSRQPTPSFTPDTVKDLFRAWRRIRRKDIDAKIGPLETQVISDLETAPPSMVVQVALKRNILLPTGTPASAVVRLWGPLILALKAPVIDPIVAELISARNKADWPAFETGDLDAAYDLWLEYLIEHATDVLVRLSEVPRPWNAKLIAQVANASGSSETYDLAKEMAAVTGATLPEFSPTSTKVEDQLTASGPWKKVQNWTPRPLGIV